MKAYVTLSFALLLCSAAPALAAPLGTRTVLDNGATLLVAERVESYERDVLLAELKRHKYHMTETAKALGLERSHLYKKCQQLGVDLQAVRKDSA